MKILYSKIKELVPDLQVDANAAGEVLTMIGMMMDSFEEVTYQGKKDYLLGLETRNRVDCLSIWGIARELAAYYGLEAKIPVLATSHAAEELHIKVEAREAVRRIKAVTVANLTNQASPKWLSEFLQLYEMNSLNLLVDLSNYAMIMTGYASHLLDYDKMNGNLKWQLNKQEQSINTLDTSEITLTGGELVISDDKNILALAGLIGTRAAAIDEGTKNVLLEMAVYEGALVKKNSRQLAIVTEAGNRLAKEMDAASLEAAFNYLVDLIVTQAGGQVVSACDYYPAPKMASAISFDPNSASRFAGIEISAARAMEILKSLRCQVVEDGEAWLVTPPSDRADLAMSEDLVEEVVRMVRYDSIPADEIPALAVTPDLTKPIYYLKEHLRDILAARGFDEVLSQPLVAVESNEQANYLDWSAIMTQNSVNEDFPVLRLSLGVSLLAQLNEFIKKNISPIRIFEIGKVFGKRGSDYQEAEHLACLIYDESNGKGLVKLQQELAVSLGQLGCDNIGYEIAKTVPVIANPHAAYVIKSGKEELGIIYKAKPSQEGAIYLAEVDLEKLVVVIEKMPHQAVVELTQKLVVLDANLELGSKQELAKQLEKISKEIGEDNLWSLVVLDTYPLAKGFRFTIRVAYHGLADQEAKAIHTKIFG